MRLATAGEAPIGRCRIPPPLTQGVEPPSLHALYRYTGNHKDENHNFPFAMVVHFGSYGKVKVILGLRGAKVGNAPDEIRALPREWYLQPASDVSQSWLLWLVPSDQAAAWPLLRIMLRGNRRDSAIAQADGMTAGRIGNALSNPSCVVDPFEDQGNLYRCDRVRTYLSQKPRR
jgi:hypothetical protein